MDYYILGFSEHVIVVRNRAGVNRPRVPNLIIPNLRSFPAKLSAEIIRKQIHRKHLPIEHRILPFCKANQRV